MIKSFIRREFIEPIWAIRLGTPLRKHWHLLEKTQYWTEEGLREYQWQQFKEMLDYVYEHNEYYHSIYNRHNLHPDDIHNPEDIQKLPIIHKSDIRENTDKLLSKGFKKPDLMEFRTGGSTGKSLTLYATEECSEKRNAIARRADRWSGWEIGEEKGAVWGNPKYPEKFRDKVKQLLLGSNPVIYLDTMHVTEESVRYFAREWKSKKPSLLFGHSHSIYLLATIISKLKIDLVKPKAIIATSMMMLPHERQFIESVFEAKVTDRYGCEEVGLIGCECEQHRGMHLNIEHLYIEFIRPDGTYAENNQIGEIIVTDLVNKAMPMIRYRLEDMGIPSDRKCQCGRGLPMMEKVIGRTADFLIKQDGTRIAGVSLIENTLTKIPGIDQMQIIQDEIDCFRIHLVPDRHFNQESENKLNEYFLSIFGDKISLSIQKLENLEQDNNGKYRFSICRVGI